MSEEKPLHVRVAEALGWARLCDDRAFTQPIWTGVPPAESLAVIVPRYDTDWSATGPLIEKYKIELSRWNHALGDRAWWRAEVWGPVRVEEYDEMRPGRIEETKGYEHPLEAVCNLILALKEAGKLDRNP